MIRPEIHEPAWSYGYTRALTPEGLVWVADAHKGELTAVSMSHTLEEALKNLLDSLPDRVGETDST
jgi:hypothetical protein